LRSKGPLMTLPGFLVQDPDGFIRLAGYRIGLHHVVRLYNEGYSPEMLLGEFPTLTLASIHEVIAFYLENAAEVDADAPTSDDKGDEQARAAPRGPGLAELQRRMQAMPRGDDATMEEAMERAYFLAKIAERLGDLDAGRSFDHEEVRRRVG